MTIEDRIKLVLKRGITEDQFERIMQVLDEVEVEKPKYIGEPVEVSERHVGCIVHHEFDEGNTDILWDYHSERSSEHIMECAGSYCNKPYFPESYPVPITYKWTGGECPVERDTLVLVETPEIGTYKVDRASEFTWDTWFEEKCDDQGCTYTQGHPRNVLGYTVLDIRGIT